MAKKSKPGRDLQPRRGAPAELRVRKMVGRVTGARLCYGKPVVHEDITVVPVANVQAAGGGGFGRGGDELDEGHGGGGGGWISATPIGYIEITPHGTRFRRIVDPMSLARATAAVIGATAALRGVKELSARRPRPARKRRSKRRRGLLLMR